MKKAVMYGGGKIGRGFIGQKMRESGYDLCFLDAVPALVDAINVAGGYSVFIVSNEGERCEHVDDVTAYVAGSEEGRKAMVNCDLMATAVGVRNLAGAAKNIAAALEERAVSGASLNIIMAENQMDVDKLMRQYLYKELSEEARNWADENLGIVAASIQRMVPQTDAAHLALDNLGVVTEAISELPVDADAIKGEVPQLSGLVPFSPFSFHEKRKLFMHNMAHALSAYLAYQQGYEYIWQAMDDAEIKAKASEALYRVASALAKEYGVSEDELQSYADELLMRFANRPLGDTVLRVGADPLRKLRQDDRLVGAALYVESMALNSDPIAEGIAAALKFDAEEDANAVSLQTDLHEKGLPYVVKQHLGIDPDSSLGQKIQADYVTLGQ